MRYKKKVPAHVEERTVDAGTTCDGCGRNMDRSPWYERNEVTLEAKIGDVYPDGDYRAAYEIDVCGACFLAKVAPALEASGLRFRQRDVEYSGDKDGRAWLPEGGIEVPAPNARGAGGAA